MPGRTKPKTRHIPACKKKVFWEPLSLDLLLWMSEQPTSVIASTEMEKFPRRGMTWQNRAAYAETQGWISSIRTDDKTWVWRLTSHGARVLRASRPKEPLAPSAPPPER